MTNGGRARSTFRLASVAAGCLALLLAGCSDGQLETFEIVGAGGDQGGPGVAGASASAGSADQSNGGTGGSALVSPFVLDDFEDGDTVSFIPGGVWYLQPDATCAPLYGCELVTDRPGSRRAMRARGGGCTIWGALLGLDLGVTPDQFDASSFQELRFWARASPGSEMELSVHLLDPLHFSTRIELTSDFREYRLPFDGFIFDDEGAPQVFDPSVLTHLQFFVLSSEDFDFWLDDVAFERSP